MAKRKLRSTYSLLPEGEQILRIKEIDDSKYDEFDKLTVILENETGNTLREYFTFVDNDGNPNDAAEGVYCRMCRTALGDQTIDECDYNDLPGCYVLVEVKHDDYDDRTYAKIKKWLGPADGFNAGSAKKKTASAPKTMSAAERIAAMRAKKG